MTATICWHCGWLDDPAREQPCPCRRMADTDGEIRARHRAAVRLARRNGWPQLATVDPTGRRWAVA